MTTETLTSAEQVAKAKEELRVSRARYNDTWREHPTAAGFPLVDKALDRLEKAEADIRQLATLYPKLV